MLRAAPYRPRRAAPAALLLAALAVVIVAGGARAQHSTSSAPAAQRLVFAHYYFSFQGDPRKSDVRPRDVRDAQGLTTLTHHPWESVGPWFSFDRAQWHKNNFQLMAAGGVDVALAVYRGDRASRRDYALKGLSMMVQGLKELRAEGTGPLIKPREYPQVGMALDLGGLAEQQGGPVDLRQPENQQALYGMIREFFTHVPEEFRATIQLPRHRYREEAEAAVTTSSTPRGIAYVVRMFGDEAVKAADASLLSRLTGWFQQDFGARLLFVGTPPLFALCPAFDAVAPHPAATADAVVDREGWIKTGSLGPGFDAGLRHPELPIRSRNNGGQLIADFRKVLDGAPDWIFIDSWNGYHLGTEIAPTLQHGLLYRDLVRAGVLQFKRAGDYSATFLKVSAPRMVQADRVYQVDVTVQNTGENDWDALSAVAVTYRWYRDGKPVGEPGAQVETHGLLRGQTKTFMVGVIPPREAGKPLPPGEYELEFDMTRRAGSETVWFGSEGSLPFRVPVTLGPPPAARPFWITSSMGTVAQAGGEYPVEIRVRNDGAEPWRKGTASLAYRWRLLPPGGPAPGVREPGRVLGEGKRVPLPDDVEPGRLLHLTVPVALSTAGGALPLTSVDQGTCVLEWDLHDGSGFLSARGAATLREVVHVVESDPAPYFLGCNLPSELVPGRTEKITVGLLNRGPNTWRKERDRIVVHWYYMDGTEAAWNDDTLALPEDVPPFSRFVTEIPDIELVLPGSAPAPRKKERRKAEKTVRTESITRPTVLRDVPVRVPYYFGPMYCVFDLQYEGKMASTGPATRGNDILVVPVNVYSPTFTPVPLVQYFDVDGMSQDVDRRDGNIDGRGNSLPAEFLPPYVPRPAVADTGLAPNPLYPSGLWARPLNELTGTRACFMFPPKTNGAPNMVSARGQQIAVPLLSRNAVHLLALATEEGVEGEVTLLYGDRTREVRRVRFTHWNDPPQHGEKVGFVLPHRHTATGDDPTTRCYINHYTVAADPLKQLAGLELPRNPAIKVMAITLESASLRAPQ